MANGPDRLATLIANNQVTGIDFVYVYTDQVHLDIYFLNDPTAIATPLNTQLQLSQIRIYSPTGESPDIPLVTLPGLTWTPMGGRVVLQIQASYPGDFSRYRLHIDNPFVDIFYNDSYFTFKANCPSDLDCEPAPRDCPPDVPVDYPVDYLARDYNSFRSALMEFASLRYPDWPDRLEADAGMMMLEVMSALGDDMAYYQDRVGREAYLESATQRRSLRYLARLVDYTISDGLGARTWLDLNVTAGSAALPAGIHAWAIGDNGLQIDFEIGHGLADAGTYTVTAARDRFQPHIWDQSQVCLLAGATDCYLIGHQTASILPFDDISPEGIPGKWVLFQTQPANPAQPVRTQMVRLVSVTDTFDPVLLVNITHIIWEPEQALRFDFDLTQLVIRGNLVPATAGRKNTFYFIVGANLSSLPAGWQQSLLQLNTGIDATTMRALERTGPNGTVAYRFSLPGSDTTGLVWLSATPSIGANPADPPDDIPEIRLTQVTFNGTCWQAGDPWTWTPSLVGVNSAESEDKEYYLEAGYWRQVVRYELGSWVPGIGYELNGEDYLHHDYASDAGVTIRFGDGNFGLLPAPGTVFRVDYRLGGGLASNVAAASITHLADDRPHGTVCDPPVVNLSMIDSVTNPLPAIGGEDPESTADVLKAAPQAFRLVTYRAVRPEDYAAAADLLPWVQNAGAAFRWTGSWLSAFVTPDPKAVPARWSDPPPDIVFKTPRGKGELTDTQRADLSAQINRYRQAGREAWVMDPIYADIDMKIEICALPTSYPGDVEARVLAVLMGTDGFTPIPGYFSPDNFTFGTPLDRSTLEAAIQDVAGVKAVEEICIRRRGWFDWKVFTDLSYDPGPDTIIRIQNDPNHPEKGILSLHIHGGA